MGLAGAAERGSQGSQSPQDRLGPERYKIILKWLVGRFKIFNLGDKKRRESVAIKIIINLGTILPQRLPGQVIFGVQCRAGGGDL